MEQGVAYIYELAAFKINSMSWQKKTSRFVLFYDILGFKDAVFRQTHTEIYEKLEALNDSVKQYTGERLEVALSEYKVQKDQIHPVIFSDSIIVFSKSDLLADATVILGVSHAIHGHALSLGLAIKRGYFVWRNIC